MAGGSHSKVSVLAATAAALLGAVLAVLVLTGAQTGPTDAQTAQPSGTVAAWGHNGSGQTSVPTGLTRVQAVAAGFSHSLAVKEDGTVVGWAGLLINPAKHGCRNAERYPTVPMTSP